MDSPLTRKLQSFVRLSETDRLWLADALGPARRIGARSDIVAETQDPRAVNVILEGWACRYKQFADGRRQIVSILLPGDACDPHVFLLKEMDHAIGALSPVTLTQIPDAVFQRLMGRSPGLEEAFQREALAAVAIQREWTVSLGRRSAIERLAHLFCELHRRLLAVGLADAAGCPMPLTQLDLADALGQTSVHINRTLQELRGSGMITLRSRHLTIHDHDGLQRLAIFDPVYLHFTRPAGKAEPAAS